MSLSPPTPPNSPAGQLPVRPLGALRPPRPRPRSLTVRHVLLFATTFVTMCLAGGGFWEGIPVHRGNLLEVMRAGLAFALGTVAILGAHEMGHFLACRYYGIPATWPYFIPGIPPYGLFPGIPLFGTFGAVIRIRGRIPDRRALFDVAAAGPIAGFLVAVPLMAYGLATAEPMPALPAEGGALMFGKPLIRLLLASFLGIEGQITINSAYGAGWFGMLITALNLFPVGQLDGGHAVYAISRRAHRIVAWTTIVGLALLLAVVALRARQLSGYVVWMAILLWMRDRHPPLLEERRPLDAPRRLLLGVLLLIFVLAFTPLPIYVT